MLTLKQLAIGKAKIATNGNMKKKNLNTLTDIGTAASLVTKSHEEKIGVKIIRYKKKF